MRILFVHQNFPGQFRHLVLAMLQEGNHEITALGMNDNPVPEGIHYVRHYPKKSSTPGIHRWLGGVESQVIRGESAYVAALQLKKEGFNPDVIIAHPMWGESLLLKDVWPKAPLGIYAELYRPKVGALTANFDPEFPPSEPEGETLMLLRSANLLVQMSVADGGISPLRWQRDSFPEPFRSSIKLAHEGIDTDFVAPDSNATLRLGGKSIGRDQEIITFVNRNLEPVRGFHVFMRALPQIQRLRPKARILIVGGDGTSYGTEAPEGRSWRQIFTEEVAEDLDPSRIHFVGKIPYGTFVGLLQISRVHVYLSYPYVLSWSLLEAMSAGCAIVASDTDPVREVIEHGRTGSLVGFFDREALVGEIQRLLESPEECAILGKNARALVQERYDLKRICLPLYRQWVDELAAF